MSDKTSYPIEPLQTSLYTLLSGITGGIYDEVPEGASLPYSTFGDVVDTPHEARGVKGRIVVVPINIYSKDSGGRYQAAAIMKEIVELVTAGALTIVGWQDCGKVYNAGKIERTKKDSGYSYHGILTFLITVCKK